MKKKITICSLILVIVVAFSGVSLSFAESVSEKQDELNSVNSKKENLAGDLKSLEKDIINQQEEVKDLEASLSVKEKELEIAQADLERTQKKMQARETGLNQRLRVMYKNGSVGFLDVLLGSNSISEFISNIEMIKKIYENDMDTLETLKKQHLALEAKKTALNQQKEKLAQQQESAAQKKSALEGDKAKLESQIDQLNAEADKIKDQIYAMQDHDAVYEGGVFMWPTTSTYITSEFGFRLHPVLGIWKGHTGIDIGVSSGSPVYASADGKVIVSGWYGGYGNAVVIDHGSGLSTLYGHNSSVNVSVGQTVKKGTVIASSGSTGISTGPHLHYEIRVNGEYVNPMSYF
ncbi:MAG: peptidoglycan DD-metalloendopeptidase family protein [Eubacteriales bacterium]|nr:peptidoglycan DD-metalloendopeptidase family protein [Eubacteriales bacterium]